MFQAFIRSFFDTSKITNELNLQTKNSNIIQSLTFLDDTDVFASDNDPIKASKKRNLTIDKKIVEW